MNFSTPSRKPKLHFETDADAASVTFDDGFSARRNFPWHHITETRFDYHEPNCIKVIVGDWMIILRGKHLDPLFGVIANQTLTCVRAHPNLSGEREREGDTFVEGIEFKALPRVAQAMGNTAGGLNISAS